MGGLQPDDAKAFGDLIDGHYRALVKAKQGREPLSSKHVLRMRASTYPGRTVKEPVRKTRSVSYSEGCFIMSPHFQFNNAP